MTLYLYVLSAMNYPLNKYRTLKLITFLAIIFLASYSCKKSLDVIPKSDFLLYPSMTVKNSQSVLMDSGKITLILSFPLLEQYENEKDPFREFRYGMNVDFYDGKDYVSGSVSAKYAKYTDGNKLWELKDSVVVINENQDKLETELLYWDQDKDLIYTDRFVKITNVDQIIMGTGFESDSKLSKRRIRKVSATITLNDEE